MRTWDLSIENGRALPPVLFSKAPIGGKFPQGLKVSFRIHQIAQTMACAGGDHQPLDGRAGFEVFPAHITGNKIIVLAVEEDHGNS